MKNKTFDRTIPKRRALVAISCAGNCGKVESAHKQSIREATYYVCSAQCEAALPPLQFGSLRVCDYNAFGAFTGMTDRPPSDQERAAIKKAMERLNIATGQIGNLDI